MNDEIPETPEPAPSAIDTVVTDWLNETTSNRGFSVEVYVYLVQQAEVLKERLSALTL
jgi:hypothetical protein